MIGSSIHLPAPIPNPLPILKSLTGIVGAPALR
jgi:hypothetical protein